MKGAITTVPKLVISTSLLGQKEGLLGQRPTSYYVKTQKNTKKLNLWLLVLNEE